EVASFGPRAEMASRMGPLPVLRPGEGWLPVRWLGALPAFGGFDVRFPFDVCEFGPLLAAFDPTGGGTVPRGPPLPPDEPPEPFGPDPADDPSPPVERRWCFLAAASSSIRCWSARLMSS